MYLIYSGNRWFGTHFEYEKDVLESKEFRAANEWGFRNYHGESICNNEYSISTLKMQPFIDSFLFSVVSQSVLEQSV